MTPPLHLIPNPQLFSMSSLTSVGPSLASQSLGSKGSFLSGLMDRLTSEGSISLRSEIFSLTAGEDEKIQGDRSGPNIKISYQTVFFEMAVEDAARGVEIHVCNPCYSVVANAGQFSADGHEDFDQQYRRNTRKDKANLNSRLVTHPRISLVNGIPSCIQAPLFLAYEAKSGEVTEAGYFNGVTAYCLWRIDPNAYNVDSQDLTGLEIKVLPQRSGRTQEEGAEA
jgi:hypothetical protein